MKLIDENAVGIILVGAEGCSETQDENWLRDSTEAEIQQFTEYYTEALRKQDKVFNLSDFSVDGTGRPYWFKTVLKNAPSLPYEKAEKYSRTVRLTD